MSTKGITEFFDQVVWVLCAMFVLAGCGRGPTATQNSADAVYDNARIWTGDPSRSWAGSLAILDGRIVAIGEGGDLEAWRGEDTDFQDLKGRLVTPGFQDSHIHIMYKASAQVDLAGAELHTWMPSLRIGRCLSVRAMGIWRLPVH